MTEFLPPRKPGIMSRTNDVIGEQHKAAFLKAASGVGLVMNVDRSGSLTNEAGRQDGAIARCRGRAAADPVLADALHMNVVHMSGFVQGTGFVPVKSTLPRIALPGGGTSPHLSMADLADAQTRAFLAGRPGSRVAHVWLADGHTTEWGDERAAGIARYRRMQEETGTHVFVVALTDDIDRDFLGQLSVGHQVEHCLDDDYDRVLDLVFDVLKLLKVDPKAVGRIASLTTEAIAAQMAAVAADPAN